jgi:peptide-methionine (S)-S-oxide reductase
MGDHTECFQIDFDPQVISYHDLLDRFWQSHDPTRRAWRTQYASLVLADDESQLVEAGESALLLQGLIGRAPTTRIEPLDRFYLAEAYHQKYYLRGERMLWGEFAAMCGSDENIVNSPAAAVANGYLYGAGSCARLDKDLPELGLSDAAAAVLRRHCR